MLSKRVCLILIVYFGKNSLSDENLPEVDTPLGRVRGSWKKTVSGRRYAAFEGIPYAKPPIGDLRFEEPVPASPWLGIWDAFSLPLCLQGEVFDFAQTVVGVEDCLYLSVYVPAEFLNTKKQIGVVVSIHGGAFRMGSGHMANSEIMLDRDIILVAMNYRLGILGFLSTEDDVIPGNNGMKDQTLALRWVKDNIHSFRGNPDSVTIIGLSSGGACVHLHYFSPLSRGLFHRGMAQSGLALAPWSVRRNPGQRAKKLAALVGCPTSSTKVMKKCLKERPAHYLLPQLTYFSVFEYTLIPFSPFGPVVEKKSPKAFLNKEPYLLLREGNVFDVPLILSITADDALMITAFFWKKLESVDKRWKDVARYVLEYNETLHDPTNDNVVDRISEYYLGPGEGINKKNFKKFTQLVTDRLFACPVEMAAQMHAKVTKSPVYVYVFNYREGDVKIAHFIAQSEDSGLDGVSHADDFIYFYGFNLGKVPLTKEKDFRMRDICQDITYSFASTGVPSFDGTDNWKPTGPTQLTYLNITGPDNMKMQTVEQYSPLDFWAKLELKENEYFLRNKDEL